MSNNPEKQKQAKSTTYFTLTTKNIGPLEDDTFKLDIPDENKLKGLKWVITFGQKLNSYIFIIQIISILWWSHSI
ncbi:MAG: hypothetical protein IIT97_02310 [Mycoplasmataceae bacterium]|nr:hypothetical protein [Mycoplasmataceae bacterium]